MNDFIFHNPDRVYFGSNQMEHLSEEVLKYGKKALLVYGGGSIKKNGLYTHFTAMAQHACAGGSITGPKVLTPSDVEEIYKMCL